MRKMVYLGFFLVTMISLLVGILGCAAPTPVPKPTPGPATSPTSSPPSEPIVLNWISFVAKNNATTVGVQKGFIDRVNEQAKGKITINFKGGPESIPSFDQAKAVQSGAVDMCVVAAGYYEPLVPGVNALAFSQVPVLDERSSGAYDYLQDLHAKGGLYLLGRSNPPKDKFFYTYLNKKVMKPEDFVGLKIGSATAAMAAVTAWGSTNVGLKNEEYYAALEQGIIDGQAGSAMASFVATGRHEIIKYVIDHPYYSNATVVIMNLAKWNKIPKDLQKLMTEAMIQSEKDNMEWVERDTAAARETMIKAKVEFYKFSPDVAKWYVDTAYKAGWDDQQKRFPEVTTKLRQFLTK